MNSGIGTGYSFIRIMLILKSKNLLTNSKNSCLNQQFRFLCEQSSYYKHYATRSYSQKIEERYNSSQKQKILNMVNKSDTEFLARFSITKVRLRNMMKWRQINGDFKSLSDVEVINGFSERVAEKFFDSVVSDGARGAEKGEEDRTLKIKGQVLSPPLTDAARQSIKTVVAVHVTAGAVCWCSVERDGRRLADWGLLDIRTPDDHKLLLTEILQIARRAASALPPGCARVLEAPPSSLRAAGGDPSNPRLLHVSLQRSQLVAALAAYIEARSRPIHDQPDGVLTSDAPQDSTPSEVVYFLRPTLPSRLFRTLVGTERVSSEQTVRGLFTPGDAEPRVLVAPEWQHYYDSRSELEREVLGQCLLLGLTFVEVCLCGGSGGVERVA